MSEISKLAKMLVSVLKEKDANKTSPYDTKATVKRVEGGTAWVHIPGGVDETPVQLTIDAKEGDSVQVRVSGGKAWLTGNNTAPPTDDAEAYKARDAAKKADIKAGKAGDAAAEADKVAKEAKKIAGDTEQHFWFTETGSDTGAHITEIPQEEWEDPNSVNYHSGGNLLARSNGIAIREGTSELATLTADGQTFNNERGYEVLTTGRLERSTYPNKVNYTEYNGESPFSYVLPWECSTFMGFDCYDASYNPVTVSAAYTLRDSVLTFDATACSELQANNVKYIKVTYTAAGRFPYFTFGSEGIGDAGRYSLREGENCIASGNTSHAEGETTMASGANSHSEGYKTQAMDFAAHAEGRETGATEPYSHAEGYEANAMAYGAHAEGRGTVALSPYQHVEGKFNIWDDNDEYAHIIGNGTSFNNLSNAFAVKWDGDVEMFLKYTGTPPNATGADAGLINAIYKMGWESGVVWAPMFNLKELLRKILGQRVLLWTNANPTNAFAAQDINCGVYDAYEIVFTGYASQPDIKLTTRLDASQSTLQYITGSTDALSGNAYLFKRNVWKTQTGVGFGDIYSAVPGVSNWARYTANTGCIPYQIYGLTLPIH